ncbi:MAG: hypothetical protein A3D44_01095 [Candidatus Staskawiczbacteria bacterium RIFCSPHIGHO2_02_FULL_42_22]|uniref:Uncharacterized protein n=1 Tax=Candidatus Staskawiczbacteria bacterium RIFCSPHIGHO2_02_FULL_42_22 TaxID=1802207 RepID=A0A1G2I3N0_9BACT|nr:MAG: hypothetical protein A3D44_01095 [Candidatus Staskawiczbacteria bacterium RIFCSPHIGHO2_02_FULL_42_22]
MEWDDFAKRGLWRQAHVTGAWTSNDPAGEVHCVEIDGRMWPGSPYDGPLEGDRKIVLEDPPLVNILRNEPGMPEFINRFDIQAILMAVLLQQISNAITRVIAEEN